jgi:hypothetical protein
MDIVARQTVSIYFASKYRTRMDHRITAMSTGKTFKFSIKPKTQIKEKSFRGIQS